MTDATLAHVVTVQNPERQLPIHGQGERRVRPPYRGRSWCSWAAAIGLFWATGTSQAASLAAISVQPQSHVVTAGAGVTLSVQATGEGPLSYEWWNEFGPLYPPQTGPSLVIASPQPGDTGRYTVRVRNAAGTVTSAEATLTVHAVNWDNLLHTRAAGGTGADPGANLDTDAAGNVYAVGAFSGTATFGAASLTSAGASDVFIVKHAPDGRVLWARRAGGAGTDAGAAISVDRMGNVRVTGGFTGAADFGGVTLQGNGGSDAFVACLDRDGQVLWARALGGSGTDRGCRIACDAAGNSYVAGEFTGTATFRGTTLSGAGATDVFLAKWSASGFPLWARRFGGAGGDRATGLALDAAGHAFVTGSFSGTADFGDLSLNSGGLEQVYLMQCDRAGAVLWARQTEGLDTAVGTSVLADELGNAFLTGAFSGTATLGSLTVTARKAVDCFVAKYTGAGAIEWVSRDGSESKLGLQSTAVNTVDGLGSGALDWSGGSGTAADLLVGRYPEPAVATWARQAGANSAPFSFGLLTDGVGNRFLTGFLENPDSTANLEGDSLTLVPLARPTGPPPPSVTLAPQNLTVNPGASATFSVAATGANLGYQWRRQGADIPGATAPSFTLANAQPADAGTYAVVVFNADGSVISPAATLAVEGVVNSPLVVITSPAEGTSTTNSSMMVFGTASGSTAISRVEAQINSGSVFNASGTASWFSFVSLRPGTNVFRARTVDTAGNTGAWVTRHFIHSQGSTPPPTSPLTLTVNGNGRVTPNLNGQMLIVGSNYTVTAVPDSGNVFTDWSGSTAGRSPTLTFTMQPSFVLRANFASATNTPPPTTTNLLVLTRAAYNGLFYESDAVRHSNSGPFTLSVSVGGSYSGSIRPGNKSISFSGRFTPAGGATNLVTLNGASIQVTMHLTSVNGADQVTGFVRGPTWEAPLMAARAATGSSSSPVPAAGRYTVAIAGAADASASPGGHGYGTITVDSAGKASLTATLGDGSAITRSVAMSPQGLWPFYASLYSSKGSAAGWITFADRATDDLAGDISWEAPAQSSRTRYPGGFTNTTSLVGSRYVRPSSTTRILNFDHGTADFAGGDLAAPFQNQIYLASTNKVHNLSANRFSLSFSLTSGTFSGSATEPGTGRSVSFKGAVLQKRAEGAGHFLGTSQSGKLDFGR